MTLAQDIKQFQEENLKNMPPEVLQKIAQSINELDESDHPKGLKVGEIVPDFTLKNAVGQEVHLYEELSKGPVILKFYRGEWCPYCNLELRSYQQKMDEINDQDAQLFAISPEEPDYSLTLKEKHDLTFQVLSDIGNKTSGDYQLTFQFPDYIKEIYRNVFQNDLGKRNNDETWTMPIPATYVIDTNKKIVAGFASADYTKRMEPAEAIEALKKLK
ncbi:peroxiredoxin-like family protein [Chengkuizengella axinellae]|uniref:thioredoxin-dependent peroxiredoxin n=1 Tax=Chengkuizengella axinellae TaxID=3064388 RepID=A0ABT9IUS2_9BACL|nr:peroxiredoxin-like family protein [Chengkuizengella sp. 2205SS18-9]MDP5272580.1 peroxiredoxin-like family protein [Chengkuizengella sp. 2205SS18-9]